jgi:trimeric autotransporter adhesin
MKTNIVSLVLIPLLVLNCFGSLSTAQAVTPPPDGGYPGGNTAEGQNALLSLNSGAYNTAVGFFSLTNDIIGGFNTAIGAGTLLANTANNNTATGAGALLSNNVGHGNTANGAFSLFRNTVGDDNIAYGDSALFNNDCGNSNTAIGVVALYNNICGSGNIALGASAGSQVTGDNNIDIGNPGQFLDSNAIRIGDPAIHGAIFTAGITAMTPATPNQMVLVDPASGQLGSADIPSSGVVSTSPENTAVGEQALASNTGGFNTATGFQALFSNTSAENNTAVGADALSNNTGPNNTAVGSGALFSNQGDPNPDNGVGAFNNAVGANALFFNVGGASNNAIGESALRSNISAADNTAIGDVALTNNDSSGLGQAGSNGAVGVGALFSNVDGNSNNAVGVLALGDNISGSWNTAIGDFAGTGNTSGDGNIYIGAFSAPVPDGESNVTRIGDPLFQSACFIAAITGTAVFGDTVVVDGNGRLGTVASAARFKKDIKPMDKTSEAILALRPVRFEYKSDSKGTPQFGLIAEEVATVNPDLVVRDGNGEIYSVRYEAVNAMLLNEFLKEHRTVQELKTIVAQQAKQIAALMAGLEKVSARLEVGQPAQRTVLNSQ